MILEGVAALLLESSGETIRVHVDAPSEEQRRVRLMGFCAGKGMSQAEAEGLLASRREEVETISSLAEKADYRFVPSELVREGAGPNEGRAGAS